MYLFLRVIKITKFASFIGSVIFMFNPFLLLWLEFEGVVSVFLWFPLILLFLEKIIRDKKYWFSFPLGATLGISLLSGYLQISLYVLLGAFIYAIARTMQIYYYDKEKPVTISRIIYYLIVSFLIGFGIAAIQLVPTFELAKICQRPIDAFRPKLLNLSSFINFLITSIFPNVFRNPTDEIYLRSFGYLDISYLGIFPLILAVSALFLRKDKLTFAIASIGIFSLLVYLQTPVKSLLYIIPGYNRGIASERIIILYAFASSGLAALGMDYMLNNYEKLRHQISRWIRILTVFSFILACLYLLGNLLLQLGKDYIIAERNKIVIPILFDSEDPSFFLTAKYILKDISNSYMKWLKNWSPFSPSIYLPFFFSGLSVFALFIYKKKKILLFKLACTAIIIADLLYFGMRWLSFNAPKTIYPKLECVDFLKKDTSLWRAVGSSNTFPPNSLMAYKIQDISGCLSLSTERYQKFMTAVDGTVGNLRRVIIYISQYNSNLLDLLNLKYILSKDEINSPRLKLVYNKDINIYENMQALPRAFIVYKAKVIKDEDQILKELASQNFNPREYAIVEDDLDFKELSESVSLNSEVKIINYKPHLVVIDTNLPNNGFLVLSDTYYPGWKAFVDGKESKVYRANYILRAVYLAKGKHQVKFIYDPLSFKVGKYISLFTLFSLSLAMAIVKLKKVRP